MSLYIWYLSDVLDDGHWGIVDDFGNIIIGAKSPLTRKQAQKIVTSHNLSVGE